MDRANSRTKSYNIPRSFEAMYINIKYELRAWVSCVTNHSKCMGHVARFQITEFSQRTVSVSNNYSKCMRFSYLLELYGLSACDHVCPSLFLWFSSLGLYGVVLCFSLFFSSTPMTRSLLTRPITHTAALDFAEIFIHLSEIIVKLAKRNDIATHFV